MSAQTIAERIKQRRTQMLIHSFLYYQMGTSVVSDHQWQHWANDLAELQRAHPIAIDFYDNEFDDWTGETGMHLPRDGWVQQGALRLLSIIERNPPHPLRPGAEPAPAPRAPTPPPAPPAPPPPAPPAPAPAPAPAQFSLF